jgi:hypothetical protein
MTDVRRATEVPSPLVKHFRQILLWPVYLMPLFQGGEIQDYWKALSESGPGNPWREVEDEFTGDPNEFQERHYSEFVAFLPPVQRFLYGQGLGKSVHRIYGESPIRVARRSDVARARVTLRPDAAPLTFEVAHVDLYFFFDIDIAMLAVEIFADDIPLTMAQEAMLRLGRAYPADWETSGAGGQCPTRVEWLSSTGAVMAASDYEDRAKYLTFVCQHRAPCISAHWEFLLRPLVRHHTDQQGPIRYRQLEYYRMPQMAFVAFEAPERIGHEDTIRLALAAGASDGQPASAIDFGAFTAAHGYDVGRRLFDGAAPSSAHFWTTGHSFVVTGDAKEADFTDLERGALARFRHQHFLLFLIAHFHKGALLMFSDRLSGAVSRFEIGDPEMARTFRRETRQALETFLRFTHRYWFYEVSNQAETQDLFDLCRRHLDIDRLYDDVRQEVHDMSTYLENEAMRHQNETVVRLTVVTTFGLIGAVVTGFLGMNLFAMSDLDDGAKLLVFVIAFVPTTLLMLYTVRKSRRLADFLEALADERMRLSGIWRALRRIW